MRYEFYINNTKQYDFKYLTISNAKQYTYDFKLIIKE